MKNRFARWGTGPTRTSLGFWICLCLGLGCGRSGPELVQVTGQVTYRGGPCPGPGSIIFAPLVVNDGSGLRPASAEFLADGKFSVRSFREGDGLKPGKYRITLQCWKERPLGYNNPGVDVVPPGFHPPDVTVASGIQQMELPLDIP